jgi:hypothetical protein
MQRSTTLRIFREAVLRFRPDGRGQINRLGVLGRHQSARKEHRQQGKPTHVLHRWAPSLASGLCWIPRMHAG